MNEEDKLLEAIESVRRDKHRPWRYILFTFYNGIAQGLGIAIGTTIGLGLVIYLLNFILSHLVGFPVLGTYFGEISKMMNESFKHHPRMR
jgi:hypothetical protein